MSHRDRHLGKEDSRQRESRWKDPEVGACLARDRERGGERKIFLKSLLKKSKCFGHFSGNRTTRMVPPGSTTKIVLVVIHGTWPLLKLPAGVNGKHHALILLK